jgi:hypothetical protein
MEGLIVRSTSRLVARMRFLVVDPSTFLTAALAIAIGMRRKVAEMV